MPEVESASSQVRKIDNTRSVLPIVAFLLVTFLILISIWFFRGGSFRLYASVFFGLYALTGQIWISVMLVGIVQSLAFLPLRFIGLKFSTDQEKFEEELEKTKSDEQYFLFTEKVRKGDPTIAFFIFNFIVNAIAFLSAGRIFLIDFYTQKLNPAYLYSFIPYPDYPLQGTIFKFPFFKVTDTTAVSWNHIFTFWLIIVLIFVVPRLLWRLVRFLLNRNKKLLSFRINYNRLLLSIAGATGTIFILSTYLMRHFPTAFEGFTIAINLTRQNTGFNLFTAVGTFLTVFHAGYTRNKIASAKARLAGISEAIIKNVSRGSLKSSFSNALMLGIGAFFVTNQIPSAFELSVATFEIIYILSPYTFDRVLTHASTKVTPANDSPVQND